MPVSTVKQTLGGLKACVTVIWRRLVVHGVIRVWSLDQRTANLSVLPGLAPSLHEPHVQGFLHDFSRHAGRK